ncbi:ATP-binding cassette domain-containing protein, partial [Lactobacillus helveticus]|uniref:ATP-binding cassette domain-containing protein n=1 Tax=Lactobacillus helveticus TaxID=1587 RepID=UPI001F18D406
SIYYCNLRRNNIGYLFQNYALINDQSIKKNLDLANLDFRISKEQFERKKAKLLKQLNIQIDERQKVGTLSGGQQQRIALVRAILKPCRLLLCDEPTGSLDPENKENLFKALEYVKTQGKTILIVSHDPYIIEHSDETYDINSLMKN